MTEHRIVPVILSGGSGTRLWPVSRESFPKQLWPLVSQRTMMQETALRAGMQDTALRAGMQDTALRAGMQDTALRAGMQDTALRAGMQDTALRAGMQDTALRAGMQDTALRAGMQETALRAGMQETALRAGDPVFAPPIVVCNHEHRFLIAEQLREVGIANARILLEPVGRNSAPAIAAAALLVDDPDAVLWMMAADAAITDEAALQTALRAAAEAARAGRIVTFGMKPKAPETGYGYIEMGDKLPGADGVYTVARFLEKPDALTASRLIADGRHLWNSGMFVFTARSLLEELERHAPDVLPAVRRSFAERKADLDFIRLGIEAFKACPSISLDYAVAERTSRAAVVPADLGWSDVGSWSALWELGAKDAAGNVALGDVVLEGAENCYVRSDGMLAAVVGLKDAVVVVTEDAVLAMHRGQAQDVKKIVERLKAAGRPEAVAHNRSYRPWGYYESLIQGERFQVKRIVVSPGRQLSLQSHFHRAEHWVVVNGTARVTRDADSLIVRENESVYLPLGCVHRLENPGRIPLTLIEVQSGAYLGEDDIVRLEDTYGRA